MAHDNLNVANSASKNLIDNMSNDRFTAEWQQQLLNAHSA
jgi:hypothetical protein